MANELTKYKRKKMEKPTQFKRYKKLDKQITLR